MAEILPRRRKTLSNQSLYYSISYHYTYRTNTPGDKYITSNGAYYLVFAAYVTKRKHFFYFFDIFNNCVRQGKVNDE